MVKNAVSEMRRYYSRKVVDVLIKVTRRTLDLIIKQFASENLGIDGRYNWCSPVLCRHECDFLEGRYLICLKSLWPGL